MLIQINLQLQPEDLKKSYEALEKEFEKAIEKICYELKDVILTEKMKQTTSGPIVLKKDTSKEGH